jgi:ribosomal protein S18 acetylase RimI-like enzyme
MGVISDFFVEEYRHQGVGRLLTSKMENYLKEKACDDIWINVAFFNTNAHNFYNKLGYSDRKIGLIKKI